MNTIQWADISRLKIGDAASCEFVADERSVAAFAELSADDNPLHMDEEVARSYGFPRRVAHGMLALSAISRLIGTQLPGPGSLWISQDLKFPAPVLVGDTLSARVLVEQISLAVGIVKLRTEVRNQQTGAVVLSGFAMIKVPHRDCGEMRSA
ncbi:MAG TPA: MaoC family dehydratase [Verrucomicrobiae bacterium]|nr:MaoC family dehydratase [Verrucomicrobiae bacterium]